jgi:phi LC3 family holin
MINWKVRFKNKNFWLAFIPAILVLVQVVAAVFGLQISTSDLQGRLLDVVNAVFMVLALLGVVTDHTTAGLADSAQAMSYDVPNADDDEIKRNGDDRRDGEE